MKQDINDAFAKEVNKELNEGISSVYKSAKLSPAISPKKLGQFETTTKDFKWIHQQATQKKTGRAFLNWVFVWACGFSLGFALTTLNGCQNEKIERASLGDGTFDSGRVSADTKVSETIEYEFPASPSGILNPGGSVVGTFAGGSVSGVVATGAVANSEGMVTTSTMPQLTLDPSFCAGLRQGECLTFILQIPAPEMQQSLGLSALSIMQHASTYRGMLERSCEVGLQSSLPALVDESGVTLLQRQGAGRKIFSSVKKTRCLIQNLMREGQTLPALQPNELGFSARLVEFEITSSQISTNPAIGVFKFEKANLSVAFHEPQVFAKNNLAIREWQPVQSWRLFNNSRIFGVAKKTIGMSRSLEFKGDVPTTGAYLQKVLAPSVESIMNGQGYGTLGIQLMTFQAALKMILSKGVGLVAKGHSAILIGAMTVNAIRDICTFDKADCRLKANNQSLVAELDKVLGKPDIAGSTLRAAFSDSLKFLPYGLISATIEEADKRALIAKVL